MAKESIFQVGNGYKYLNAWVNLKHTHNVKIFFALLLHALQQVLFISPLLVLLNTHAYTQCVFWRATPSSHVVMGSWNKWPLALESNTLCSWNLSCLPSGLTLSNRLKGGKQELPEISWGPVNPGMLPQLPAVPQTISYGLTFSESSVDFRHFCLDKFA